MRLIGLIATGLCLSACTTSPIFPPAVMKEFETNTIDIQKWVDQAYHSPNTEFIPHKAKLAGVILDVIRQPDGVVIVVKAQPLKTDLASDTTRLERDSTPWVAVTFQGTMEQTILQTGNRLVAVGTTNQASVELFGGAPRLLPHLRAQCLRISNDQGVNNMYACPGYTWYAAVYPPEERTFCLEEIVAESMSSARTGEQETASGGL